MPPIDLIEDVLRRAGCSLADIVKVTVWLTHADHYPEFQNSTASMENLSP